MKVFIYIAYLFAVFFVPLLPAYLLYRYLPSKATVRGPFKGLNISLTGAFGGYFLLVLIALSFTYSALTPSKPGYEVWRVTGTVEAKSTDPGTGKEMNDVVGTIIGVTPPNYTIGSGGEFGMTIMVMPGHVEGQRLFPTLVFNRPGYTGVVLPLNAADVDVNEKTKAIRLKQRIMLGRLKDKVKEPRWKR